MASEVSIRGVTYHIGRLSARQQWNVVRRIMPLIQQMVPALREAVSAAPKGTDGETDWASVGMDALGPLAQALADLSDADSDYVIDTCISVVRRPNQANQLVPMARSGQLMFQDQDDNMVVLLGVTAAVIQENIGPFFGDLLGQFGGQSQPQQ